MATSNSEEENLFVFHSVDELIEAFKTKDQKMYGKIISSMTLPDGAFANHCSWSTDTYTRNCLFENAHFELILLCWSKGQITPIHNHGGEECWVKIIDGAFQEVIYTTNDAGKLIMDRSIDSQAGDVTYMVDFMGYHSIENKSSNRGMTLHLYAKPILNCKVFDKHSSQFIDKHMQYDTCPELVTD